MLVLLYLGKVTLPHLFSGLIESIGGEASLDAAVINAKMLALL